MFLAHVTWQMNKDIAVATRHFICKTLYHLGTYSITHDVKDSKAFPKLNMI